jgi:glyoxylase I family protein
MTHPNAPLPVRLHHHAFVTTDQAATRRFYEEIIGLPLIATWTEVEDLLGEGEQQFCHTFYGLADGSALAFFQFDDDEFSRQYAAPPPPSLFRHVALLVTAGNQAEIADRAEHAGVGTMMADHGFCTSLYITDPNGLLLEFTVDHPEVLKIDALRKETAHRDLDRWLSGDHRSNNDWRPDP